MHFDKDFIAQLLENTVVSGRLRQHYNLRNAVADTSQRMLKALLPGTEVVIYRHEETTETVVCLLGKLEEVMYEEIQDSADERMFREVFCQLLCPQEGRYGM